MNRQRMRFLICVLAILGCNAFPMLAADRPNVIVILVDDLGYGDLSSYGAQDLKSPHVDGLIASGMRFNNFYANCPVCSPTRASLMTGRYPELVGVPGVIRTHAANSWGYLAKEAVMLPEVFRDAGYDTAMFGKWHLGLEAPNRPNDRGFVHFLGYLGDMMDDYYNHRRHGINYMRLNTEEIDPVGHATDLFTDWACNYLETRTDQAKPFFMYLAYNAPHTPIQPPDEWTKKILDREVGIDPDRAKLVALIEHLDDGIGKVMRKLKATKLDSNTVVVFSSDNGGQRNVKANNGNLRDGKQSMYEGGLKVATGVVWPGTIEPGTTSNQVLATMDLFPTLCEIAKTETKSRVDGVSFLPTLLGKESTNTPRYLFFHRREGGDRYAGLTTNAVRWNEWKLLQNSPFQPLELYNLATDPAEEKDLAKSSPMIFRQLSQALRVQVQRGGAVPWQPPTRRDTQQFLSP